MAADVVVQPLIIQQRRHLFGVPDAPAPAPAGR
jgi:hypothetical protein